MGRYADEWMAEAALAMRAELPVAALADAVHSYPAYGEVIGHLARELASGTPNEIGAPMSESDDLEKPVVDADEQLRDATGDPEAAGGDEPASVPFDVNEADAVEQHREVSLDEEDYR